MEKYTQKYRGMVTDVIERERKRNKKKEIRRNEKQEKEKRSTTKSKSWGSKPSKYQHLNVNLEQLC